MDVARRLFSETGRVCPFTMAYIAVQGPELDESQLPAIQRLVGGNPRRSRRRMAAAWVQGWDWRNAAGAEKTGEDPRGGEGGALTG